jgi:hypothetical protein
MSASAPTSWRCWNWLGRNCFLLVMATLAATSFACAAKKDSQVEAPERTSGEFLEFAFAGLSGEAISSAQTRGRVTVLLFVTTFDLPSQAAAKRLEDLYRTHVPRLNAVAVVMEAPRHVELARAFRETLGLSYPLGMVDKRELSEHPQLRNVQTVPSWIFLSRQGRVSFVAVGGVSPEQLEEAARSAAE